MNYSYEELNRISTDFRDLAGDLLRADTDNFNSAINFFKSFCNENEIIQEILKPIKERNFDSQEWYETSIQQRSSMVGSGDATLPHNKLDALRAIYDMLWNENALNILLDFGHSTMFKKNFDEQLRTVNDKVTSFFVRYIIRQLEEKIELVKPQGNQPIQNNMTINGPANVANQSQNFTQTMHVQNSELQSALSDLRSVIDQSRLSHEDKQDALETADMIEDELQKPNPRKSKIQKIASSFPAIDSLTGIIENIVALISN